MVIKPSLAPSPHLSSSWGIDPFGLRTTIDCAALHSIYNIKNKVCNRQNLVRFLSLYVSGGCKQKSVDQLTDARPHQAALSFLHRASSSPDASFSSRYTISGTLSPLLSLTDILVLLLYIFAFAALSDHIVPSRILRGARSGTSCYVDNHFDRYDEVLLRECVLGQHGYWWCMGATLGYLMTSIAGSLVWVEERVERKMRHGKTGLMITGNNPGPIALGVGEEDAVSLRETGEVEEALAEREGNARQ